MVHQLIRATGEIKASQQTLQQTLQQSCQKTEHLRIALEDIAHERTIDALTGLKNAGAMRQYMDN
ncbi:MAG: PleD family two-component response regulator [Alteromonadaceae bacterium]|jgi:PleD family two-component response regulator